jgi:hypothetical protein
MTIERHIQPLGTQGIGQINVKRKPKGRSRMDRPEKPEGSIDNGQSKDTFNIKHTRDRPKKNKTTQKTE